MQQLDLTNIPMDLSNFIIYISLRPTVQYKIENKRQNYKFHVVLFVCTNIYK